MLKRFLLAAFVVLSVAGCAAPAAQAPAQPAAPTTAPAAPTTAVPKAAAPTTAAPAATAAPKAAATTALGGRLVVYAGHHEEIIAPLVENFKKATGVDVQVRYAGTPELVATVLEEGANSPADVFISQDAGALGALDARQQLSKLPDSILNKVDPRFRAANGDWTGISARGRVIVYNTKDVKESDLPASVLGLTDPKWKGKIGWAPPNGSFQAFVTGMRKTLGDDATRQWLTAMKANNPRAYDNNDALMDALVKGEVSVALLNHYYLLEEKASKGPNLPAALYYPPNGDIGAMVNVAGVGILPTAKNRAAAEAFITYLLSEEAQKHIAEKAFEYPLAAGVKADPSLKPLDQIQLPKLQLGDLADLEGTLKMLRDSGVLS